MTLPMDTSLMIPAYLEQRFLCYESPLQIIAGFKWKLAVYPYGDTGANRTALSLYLQFAEASGVPPVRSLFVKHKLRIMDQISSNHVERTDVNWFIALGDNWGYSNFVSLENLRNASKGFLLDDVLTVEAEIVFISKVECVP
ncbi:hypothetical protein CRYUN_Cryun14cG0014800 [Craigia yunnanensis]